MEKLTDRSPRTPPALSNAAPPEGRPYCTFCGYWHYFDEHCPDSDLLHSHIMALRQKAAAPPVAEGPAATPRPITIQNETLYRDPDNPDCLLSEMQWKQRIAGPSGVSQPMTVTAGVSTQTMASGAAAEPFTQNAVEGPAADPPEMPADWLNSPEITTWRWQMADPSSNLSRGEQDIALLDAYAKHVASDLLRQLDEARREREAAIRILKEFHVNDASVTLLDHVEGVRRLYGKIASERESAEAANQKHRGALAELYVAVKEDSPERLRMAMSVAAALLGPQHGDTK